MGGAIRVAQLRAAALAAVLAVPCSARALGSEYSTNAMMPNPSGSTPRAASAANFWFGSQLAYSVPGVDPASENVLVAGNASLYLLTKPIDRVLHGLLAVANFSELSSGTSPDDAEKKLVELMRSSQGISVGLHAYRRFLLEKLVTPTVYGYATYKLNASSDPAATAQDDELYLHQVRLVAGGEVELAEKVAAQPSPATISASITYALPLNETDFDAILPEGLERWSGEVTLVVPIQSGFGFLAEWTGPLNGDFLDEGGARLGFIFKAGTRVGPEPK